MFLGADALPGDGVDANARLSTLDRLIQWLALRQQEGETDAQS